MATSARSYNDAIDALNSLQTPFHVIDARRKAGVRPGDTFLDEMRMYLRRIGHSPADLDRLNIVHVAGTKGKGSTCAFVNSILEQYRLSRGSPHQVGLFTSPHLVAVRERIRINSAPISEHLFAKYFFDVWDRLGSAPEEPGDELRDRRPAYARYLTLMSWHVFLEEGVDVAVYETGVGGEYDATNLVERPVATGITTLGIDHVFSLGDTVDKIAWHKAGIMKKGSAAFTIDQVPEAAKVLENRAEEKGVVLKALPVDSRLKNVKIRPNAQFQKRNATLAVALADAALGKLGLVDGTSSDELSREFIDGLESTLFRGRCEVKEENKVVWYVDGAHTADSLKVSARWFAQEAQSLKRPGPRILIFNQQTRDEAITFLQPIHAAASRAPPSPTFDHVIFCTNVTYASSGYKRDFVNHGADPSAVEHMTVQKRFAEKWAELDPGADVRVLPTIEEALEFAREIGAGSHEGEKVQAFVTGSLHLVGGALGILEKADAL